MPVALITGASSGIGEALSHELARQGFKLCLLARREDRLNALASELSQTTKVITQKGDVTDPLDLRAAVQKTIQDFGCLNYVFANAGFGVSGLFEKLTNEDYARQFEVNVFGVMNTLRESFEALKITNGRVCIIGSVMSYVSAPGSSPYVMSKFCVRALAESLYHEWYPYGISVTLACPGMIESEIRRVDNQGRLHPGPDPVPKRFVMNARLCAKKIIAATKARRREIVITAHGKLGVFLARHMPWLLHWGIRFFRVQGGKQKSRDVQSANV